MLLLLKIRKLLPIIAVIILGTQSLRSQAPTTEGPEILISRDFARQPSPRWSNGYLLGYEFEPRSAPTTFAYDRNGTKLFERPLSLEGAHEIFFESTAATRDGRFAFAGLAVALTGERVGFIAFVDRAGRLTHVVRPERFYPQHLCFTSDGTLWVAGTVGGRVPEEEHNVIRAYTSEGKLKFSLLPRSSFAPTSRYGSQSYHPAIGRSALATNDKVVVFLAAGFQELIGISLDGNVLMRTPTEVPSNDFMSGLAVGPDGRVLISVQRNGTTSISTGSPEFAFYQFDPSNGNWMTLYSRSARLKGLPQAISLVEGDQMLIKIDPVRFRWMSRLP